MVGLFDTVGVWYDDQPRTGAENMAVDQLLAERVGERPILRVYSWLEPTVSFGYSHRFSDAAGAFSEEGLRYVRRWTGGGVVDHRRDIAYTLVVPESHVLAGMRGGGSYEAIHCVLARALAEMGEEVMVIPGDLGDGAAACFLNPVAFDVVNGQGVKVAGAGQRRTRWGLLHQGSLVFDLDPEEFCGVFARQLSVRVKSYCGWADLLGDAVWLARERYATEEWLMKR